jgi:hypothetical protein
LSFSLRFYVVIALFFMLTPHGSPCKCFVLHQHFIVDVVVTQVWRRLCMLHKFVCSILDAQSAPNEASINAQNKTYVHNVCPKRQQSGRKCVSRHRMYFLALGTFSYFWAHRKGRSSVWEYVEVSDQRQTSSCYCHL